MSKRGARLPDAKGGQLRGPVPLYCAQCLSDGLPEPLALIGPTETLYANADGEPVCSSCGFTHNLTAMDRRD